MYILQLKFYLKNDAAVYFLKNILNKAWIIFAFTADSLQLSRIDFIVFNVSQKFAAKRTTNKLQIKENAMCKDSNEKIN